MAYELIVGNIGSVYVGRSKREAMKHFAEYVSQSKSGHGRAGGEDVTLLQNDEPIKEHFGNLNDWEDREGDESAFKNPRRKRRASPSIIAAHARGVRSRKAPEKQWVKAMDKRRAYVTRSMKYGKLERIALQFYVHGVWATIKLFPRTEAGKRAAVKLGLKMHPGVPHRMRAIPIYV